MEITVVLYATLARLNPQGEGARPFTVEAEEGATVEDLLEQIGVDREEAKQVFIRNRSHPFDHVLQDGDRVAVFPPVGGG